MNDTKNPATWYLGAAQPERPACFYLYAIPWALASVDCCCSEWPHLTSPLLRPSLLPSRSSLRSRHPEQGRGHCPPRRETKGPLRFAAPLSPTSIVTRTAPISSLEPPLSSSSCGIARGWRGRSKGRPAAKNRQSQVSQLSRKRSPSVFLYFLLAWCLYVLLHSSTIIAFELKF